MRINSRIVLERSTQYEGEGEGYKWFVLGDINGFFGLMFDNITVLSFMAGILIGAFQFPANIVYGKMIPGTAFGVLFGDLVYTWMAFQLAKRSGRSNITAMPLGLDTPSTIGIAFVVLGPAFLDLKKTMPVEEAAMMTWYVGMAHHGNDRYIQADNVLLWTLGQKIVPQAGLLGSLAGIGCALIGFVPLVEIFELPPGGYRLTGSDTVYPRSQDKAAEKIPGVFAAICIGTLLYHILGPMHLIGSGVYAPPAAEFHFGFPVPTLDFLKGFSFALKYLPIALPFAILTVVGGINVTESARVGGDDYNTRDILLTEAIATLLAGVCGGVAQSTPYIGQPAYKGMGSRAGYTLLTGLFIGLGGILGYVPYIVELIPRAVLAPILIFVALDIMEQAFHACPVRHAPAVAFAFFPTIARLVAIQYNGVASTDSIIKTMVTMDPSHPYIIPPILVTVALGNGFILTSNVDGRIPGGADKQAPQTKRHISLYHGIALILWHYSLLCTERRHVRPMDTYRSGAAGALPVCHRICGTRPDVHCPLLHKRKQGALSRRR